MGKIMHQGVNYSSINDTEHLSNLQDTQISNPADGNILQYDGNTNKWKNVVAQEHTTFNGRSGSILPMAGDYSAEDITYGQSTVKDALDNIGNSVVSSFNGRSGSVLPTAGDYTADKIIFSSIMHIGGETQDNVEDAIQALSENSSGGSNIEDLSNVNINSPIDGDYLEYDGTANIWINKHNIKIVTWHDGTDEEIAAMLEAHYNGDINITDYWTVGDERQVSLSAMAATGVDESHRAQDVTMVILDFNHDDLTTPINEITKAAITIQQKNCLRDASVTDTTGSSNTENGYINSSNTNVGGWTSCARRTWCNSIYYNALPSNFKKLVKQVNKLTSAGNQSSTINTDADYCWLPSEIEVFNSFNNSKSGEGTQYSYYTTTANRYKLPKWNSSYVSDFWWERSPYGSNSTAFCRVDASGSASYASASSARGLAPACCL